MDKYIYSIGHATLHLTLNVKLGNERSNLPKKIGIKPPLHPIMAFPIYWHALRIEEFPRDILTSNGRPIDQSQGPAFPVF